MTRNVAPDALVRGGERSGQRQCFLDNGYWEGSCRRVASLSTVPRGCGRRNASAPTQEEMWRTDE